MKSLNEIKDVTNSSEKQALLMKYMNLWANTFNDSTFRNLGDKIKLLKIVYFPMHIFVVHTMSETRTIIKKSTPYPDNTKDKNNAPECKYFEPGDVDAWRLNLKEVPFQFAASNYNIPVPNSSCIKQCTTCCGKGKSACINCNSKGHINCETCEGTGHQNCTNCAGRGNTICTYCGGAGTQNVQKIIEKVDHYGNRTQSSNYENVQCTYCTGRGNFACSLCKSGVVTCSQCGGNKKQICQPCQGSGHNVCNDCAGAGNILWSLEAMQDFEVSEVMVRIINPEIKRSFPEFDPEIDIKNPGLQMIHSFESPEKLNIPECFAILCEKYGIDQVYVNEVYILNERELSNLTGRISKQRLTFFQADMYVVAYEFLDKNYTLILDYTTGNIHAPVSPFTELAAQYIQKAQSEIPSKNYGEAMKWAQEAYDLSKGSGSESIAESLIKEITKLMTYHYRVGISSGAITFWVIQGIIDLFKANTHIVQNLIKNTGIILFLYIITKVFDREITSFMPKVIISNDNVRILIGAVAALIVLFILSGIIGTIL